MNKLFEPLTLGELSLQNRVVMAPMTRSRALPDGTPSALSETYYQQRASAGLIISEGVYPSEDGKGYCRTPGIVSASHIAAWKKITDAVHQQGGLIVMQLMHCGRVACAANKQSGSRTVAPSAIRAGAQLYTEQGMMDCDFPDALSEDEIQQVIEQYRQATENALAAGFDGVELHCTSGYLPAQFLSTGTNQRVDQWGGPVENRVRFVVETLKAICSVAGAGKVGMRICPANPYNDLSDENPLETFQVLLKQVRPLNLAYLHAIKSPDPAIDVVKLARDYFQGPLVINEGFDADSAREVIESGDAAAVSFGKPFIANPDLVERYQNNWPLNELDFASMYTPGEKGYIDYPFYPKS